MIQSPSIKPLCKLGNNAFLLCIALIWCLSKLPISCRNFSFPVLHVCFTAHSWLPQGIILVNSCNSGDKCNCQNNKYFIAVYQSPRQQKLFSTRNEPTTNIKHLLALKAIYNISISEISSKLPGMCKCH